MNAINPSKGWKVSTGGRSMDILSREWIARPADERFLDLPSLIASLDAKAENRREVTLKNAQLEVLSPGITGKETREELIAASQQLALATPAGDFLAPTHWVFGQLAGLAGNAPAAYLRKLPTSIVADALQYGLRFNRSADDVKLYADDMQALALTGPDYGRILNRDIALAVQSFVEPMSGDHRWKIPGRLDWNTHSYDPLAPVTPASTTLFANDRTMMIFLCQDLSPIEIGKLPDGSPDLVFRGFYVKNSEVGAGSFTIGALYVRGICDNRIFWGVEGFEEMTMRHSKYAPDRFIEEARPALKSFAEGSTSKLIEGVAKAKEAVLADSKADALAWLSARDISRKAALAVYDAVVREEWGGEEDEARPMSAWDMAQGITAHARTIPNADSRMDFELGAKRLLDKVAA